VECLLRGCKPRSRLLSRAEKRSLHYLHATKLTLVGRHRGGWLGRLDMMRRKQTLNQLLVEMDGFESNEGVILIARLNRPDVLDPALLRPEFDRRVVVQLPDVRGREEILRVQQRKIPLADDSGFGIWLVAPGFSGAELSNMVNEAALNAARAIAVSPMYDSNWPKIKFLMGAERKSMLLTEEEKNVTDIRGWTRHCGALIRMPIRCIRCIIPRGMALGVTMQLPETE